jgi:hypothetical protein
MSAPLFIVEVDKEWRLEFYDDGSVRYMDFVGDITEIMFGVEI